MRGLLIAALLVAANTVAAASPVAAPAAAPSVKSLPVHATDCDLGDVECSDAIHRG